MSTASQGHSVRGYWLKEDNGFNQSPNDTEGKPFGGNATVDSAEGSNQAVQVFGPDSRVPVDIIETLFDGSWSVSFTLTNPYWLYAIFGEPSTTDNGDGSYSHDYGGEDPGTIRIPLGFTDSGKIRALTGCICTTADISTSIGGEAEVSMQGAYAEEKILEPDELDPQPEIDHKPFTFAEAALEFGGNTLGYVQQGTLSIQNNVQMIHEWGSRVAIDYSPRTLTPSVNFSKINEAGETTYLEDLYGGSTEIQEQVENKTAMVYKFDNGKAAGSGINSVSFSLEGTFPESYGQGGLGDPEADITEDLNRLIETMTASATNETQTAP